MADLSITAANVQISSGTPNTLYNAGEALTAGDMVYLKTETDGSKQWYQGQCDGTAAESTVQGMVLGSVSAGQRATVAPPGAVIKINGATYTNFGQQFYLSAAKAKVCPYADLVTTNKVVFALWVSGANTLTLNPRATGLTL